jgi:hypothetical protein
VLIGDRHRVEIRVIAQDKPKVVARASDQRAIEEVTQLLASLDLDNIPPRRIALEDIRRAIETATIDPLLERRVENTTIEWGTCDFVSVPCDVDWCDFDVPDCDLPGCDGCGLGCDL